MAQLLILKVLKESRVDMTDEAELLQRLRNREKNSIDEAIRIYTPYLSTVLYHMAGNSLPKEDIEEIVADVFIVLWKNAGRIDLQKGTLPVQWKRYRKKF